MDKKSAIIKNKHIIYLYFLWALFSFKNYLYGQYLPTDWSSTSATGRGGAFTAWANDGAAIFSNPAGLSLMHNKLSKNIINGARSPLPDEFEANDQMLSKLEDNYNNWTKNLLDSAFQNTGKPSYLALQAFPYLVFGGKKSPTFMIGAPVRTENSAVFTDTANPNNATVNSINTASGAIAIADSTRLGGFRWGFSVRPNYRIQYQSQTFNYLGDLSTNTFVDTVQNQGIKSTAIAMDAGFTATMSDYWFPTIGFSVRNIPTGCITNYIDPITYKVETMCGVLRNGAKATDPNESQIDPTEIRAGVSVTPRGRIAGTILNLRLSADVYPIPITINNKNYGIPGIDPANLVHAGGELFFGSALAKNNFALRGGYMNQNASWGGSINLYLFTLGYSSYVATSAILNNATGTIDQHIERRHLLYLGWQL